MGWPADQTNIGKLENIQKRFTSKFAIFRRYDEASGLSECHTDYWERLDKLKLYSLERRRDRYIIMYMYKIHIGAIPNVGFRKDWNDRSQTKFFAKHNRKARRPIKGLRRASFFSKGPQLFNMLPEEMRELKHVAPENVKKEMEDFKKKLDKWLALIPDQPTTEGLTPRRQANDNSLPCQYQFHHKEIKKSWKTISDQMKREERARTAASGQQPTGTQQQAATNQRTAVHQHTATHNQHDSRVNRVWWKKEELIELSELDMAGGCYGSWSSGISGRLV